MLERALTLVGEGEREGALVVLLEVWRRSRAPALADLIERVSGEVVREPLPGRSATARFTSFLEVAAAKDPKDLPRLLAVLGEGQNAQFARQVELLAAFPADPRLTEPALRLLRRPPSSSSSSHTAWRRLFKLLGAWGDVRALEALRALDFAEILGADGFASGFFREQAGKTIAALEKVTAALSLEEAVLVERMNTATRTDDVEALFAAVYANPDDAAARQVLGDRLQERGDPRGELIALSAQPSLDERRIGKLLEQHRAQWLGPFEGMLHRDAFAFERGFPSLVTIEAWEPAVLRALHGRIEWSTIRTLGLVTDDETALPVEFLRHPVMRSVTALGRLGRRAFFELWDSKEAWPYREVGTYEPHYESPQFEEDLARLCFNSSLPNLETLKISGYLRKPAEYRPLFASELFARLSGFGVSRGLYRLSEWVAEIEQAGLDARLTSFDLSFDFGLHDFVGILRRGADGRLSRLEVEKRPTSPRHGPPKIEQLTSQLERLPTDRLTSFDYRGRLTRAERVGIDRALARQTRLTSSASSA